MNSNTSRNNTTSRSRVAVIRRYRALAGALLVLAFLGICAGASAAEDPALCTVSKSGQLQIDVDITSPRDADGVGTPVSAWVAAIDRVQCRPGTVMSPILVSRRGSFTYVQDVTVEGITYGMFKWVSAPVYYIADYSINGIRHPMIGDTSNIISPAPAADGIYVIERRMRIVTGPVRSSGIFGTVQGFLIRSEDNAGDPIFIDPQTGDYKREPLEFYSSFQANYVLSSCSVNATQTVALGKLQRSAFSGVGSIVPTGKAALLQFNCPATSLGLTIEATLTDANDRNNWSDRLSLSNGPKMATGIAIQLLSSTSGGPLSYGLESADRENPNQFWIEDVGPDGKTKTTPLAVRLIQTDATIRPGKINAQAIITFSYQ